MRWRPMLRGWSVVVGGALFVTLAVGLPQASAAGVVPKEVQKLKSVPGKLVPVKPLPANSVAEFKGGSAVAWPAAGVADVAVAGVDKAVAARAGQLPVWVNGVAAQAGPGKVRVEVLGQDESAKAGVAGVLVRIGRVDGVKVAGPVSVSVDYNGFRDAYGGDWSSRLSLVPLSGGALAGPVTNDVEAGRVTAQAQAAPDGAVYALAADPGGATGDYKATSLKASMDWHVSAQTGSFDWAYPLRAPAVPGDLKPDLQTSYDSGSVDGRVPTANNQTSWVGEGWDLQPGFIERRYATCGEDLEGGNQGSTKTGDECWRTDNATLSLGGRSGELVKNGTTDVWRLKNDDGSRLEHLYGSQADNGDDNGEHWRLTTNDGTQYNFGLNKMPDGRPDTQSTWTVPVAGNNPDEPCHKATFATSFCAQAYRWNLDYVVDVHGNAMVYSYTQETNKYGRNLGAATDSYVRGGVLRQIDYGLRVGNTGQAPARVVFDPADRCVAGGNCAVKTRANWPDTPWDQDCSGATCPEKFSPTYWSTKRLAKVTTQILKGSAGCTKVVADYCAVEEWTFNHRYPDPGDHTDPSLWLDSIGHSGLVGGTTPGQPVSFILDPLHRTNRVDSVHDGLPKGNKNRILSIITEAGGEIDVNYAPLNCSADALPLPDSNTLRCYPVRWAPDKVAPVDDWFHKYVVQSVALIDRTGGAPTQFTNYDYRNGGGWKYDDDPLVAEKYRSWTSWRGYDTVQVRKGDPANPGDKVESATLYRYFRGMTLNKVKVGDPKAVTIDGYADEDQLSGFLREQILKDGPDGNEVKATVNDPWSRGPTSTQGADKAYMVKVDTTYTRTALKGGGTRKTKKKTSYGDGTQLGDVGLPTQVNDSGDVDDPNDDQCVTTTYAVNTDTWLVELPKTEKTVGVACGAPVTLPRDSINDKRSYYDKGALDAKPTGGNMTSVEELATVDGSTGYVTKVRSTYDEFGRVTSSTDALDHKSSTSYDHTNGLVTSSTETDALGHRTITTFEPAWSEPTSVVDENAVGTGANSRVDTALDSLGRLLKVWAPGRSKANGDGPTTKFDYGIRIDGASWVTTDRLKPNNNYVTTVALYDSFLRPRQTQEPSPQLGTTTHAGRKVTDTFYDTRGLVGRTNAVYYNDQSNPDKNLLGPDETLVPNQTVNVYDGAERKVKETYEKFNEPQWNTSTVYNGDSVTVTPPAGGTPTTTFTNARGLVTELREYTGGTPSDYLTTRKSYTRAGELETVTDAANNVWTSGYDVSGNKIKDADPDKGTSVLTYDKAGNVVTSKDARDQVTANVYDQIGRRTELHRDSVTGPLLASWTYDTVRKGQLSSTTRYDDKGNAYVNKTTGYDLANRPTDTEITIPDNEGGLKGIYQVHTSYLPDGSIGSVSLPKLGDLPAETVTYGYDTLGQPTTTKGKDTYVSSTLYTALGEVSQTQSGVDGKRLWQTVYYEEGTRRLANSLVEREAESSAKVDETAYTYDPIGNVRKVDDSVAGSALDRQCMNYDGLRRLTDAWTTTGPDCSGVGNAVGGPAPYWNTYRVDGVGRRLSQTQHGLSGATDTVTTMTYPDVGKPQPHAPATIAVAGPLRATAANGTYSYDKTGNTTARPTGGGDQTYGWDAEGQLSQVTAGGKTTTYVNTPDNSRLLAKQDTEATLYLLNGEMRLDKATGKVTGTRYYMRGEAVVAARTVSGVSYLAGDQQGTNNLAVDAVSLTPTKRRFDAFGVPRGAAPPAWPGERGFVGGPNDKTTGLTRLGVRDYDATTGRFASVDPVLNQDDPQQLNGYSYSGNNPTSFSDPGGKARRPVCNAQGDCIVGHYQDPPEPAAEPIGRTGAAADARKQFFGAAPAGSRRIIVKTKHRTAKDNGILILRFFIKSPTAAFGELLGDGRDFSTDVRAGYRFVIAWDTLNGDVSITFSPSTTNPSAPTGDSGISGGPAPKGSEIAPRELVLGDGSYLQNSIQFSTGDAPSLGIHYKAMNSFVPVGQVEGTASMGFGPHGNPYGAVHGEKYPDVEMIHYRNTGATSVGHDEMSGWEELAALGDHPDARFVLWGDHPFFSSPCVTCHPVKQGGR
jgi:RHS repeat-associated protein